MRALMYILVVLVIIGSLGETGSAQGGIPAFPGAEGYGAESTGGRGGQVLHVTNLNASGPGSLQAALSTPGSRIIVFDVSGVIEADELVIEHGDVTIAGETAPGGGITIAGCLNTEYLDYSVTNMIIRFLRVRPRNLSGDQGDAMRFANNSNFILDHISTSWGSDETIDVYQSHDFTIQWSTIEESATYAGHSDGNFHNYGLINGPAGSNVSIHHNLFAHHSRRTPAIANGTSDIRNNLVYNVRDAVVHHNPSDGTGFNMVGNYFRTGPDRSDINAFWLDDEDGVGGSVYYIDDVYLDDADGYIGVVADPWSSVVTYPGSINPPPSQASSPFSTPVVATHASLDTYTEVLQKAGAFPRDTVTIRTINEVETRTGSWGRDVPADLMEGLTPGTAPTDTDGDGMPDNWETTRGLNPNVQDHNGDDDSDSYTNIEEYLHELAAYLMPGSELCGPISGILLETNSPYTITCDIQVDAGESLEIEAGVELIGVDNYSFTVNGELTWYP